MIMIRDIYFQTKTDNQFIIRKYELIQSKSGIYKTEPEYFVYLHELASKIYETIMKAGGLMSSAGFYILTRINPFVL